MDILSFLCILINLEKLFCQMFFKMAPTLSEKPLHQEAKAGAVFGGAGALPNRPLQ